MDKRLMAVVMAMMMAFWAGTVPAADAQDVAPDAQPEEEEEYVTERIGDMLIDVPARSPLGATGFVFVGTTAWPGGVLPIVFEAGITQAQANKFFYACNTIWRGHANVSCVNRTTQAKYVLVTKSQQGCFAYLGAPKAGAPAHRQLNLAEPGCWEQGVIVHEIGHSLGMMHEHQRPDRDNFVQIRLENVVPGQEAQFNRWWQGSIDWYSPSYDFGSVMHYGATFFSKNGQPTIAPLPQYAHLANGMGTTQLPSANDGAVMRAVYGANTAQAPGAPTLALLKTSNPVQLQWTPSASGGAPTSYTLLVAMQPGGAASAIPMGGQTSLTAEAPLGVPLYLRIMATNAAGSAYSSEVRLVAGGSALTMNRPDVRGRTVTLSWAGAANVLLNVRTSPTGPIVAQAPVSGTSLVVHNVALGTYYLTVSTGAGGESNQVVLVVR